jgi:hypothetical protein
MAGRGPAAHELTAWSAPGASISAEHGTGTGTTAFGGTSGAAPMVAGAAALMVQAHPARSALQIKALLMNSAETVVYTNPATLPGGLAPITRIGAGELRVNRAVALSSAAWDTQALSAALSFGAVEAEQDADGRELLPQREPSPSRRACRRRRAPFWARQATVTVLPVAAAVPVGWS